MQEPNCTEAKEQMSLLKSASCFKHLLLNLEGLAKKED